MISFDYVRRGKTKTAWVGDQSDLAQLLSDWNDPEITYFGNVVPSATLPKGFITRLSASRVEYYHRPGEGRDDPL